jgi:hypothetical protein
LGDRRSRGSHFDYPTSQLWRSRKIDQPAKYSSSAVPIFWPYGINVQGNGYGLELVGGVRQLGQTRQVGAILPLLNRSAMASGKSLSDTEAIAPNGTTRIQ